MKACCIENCKNECLKGRRYCREHYLERKRKQAKEHYIKYGRYNYNCICIMCGKHFIGARKEAQFCSKECLDAYHKIDSHDVIGKYLFKKKTSINAHRAITEELLQRKLTYNEVVHHIDGNPKNNNLDNLLVLSRSNHIKLHRALIKKKALVLHEIKNLLEDTWIEIKKKFTKEWLKENNIQYLITLNIK